MNNLNNYLDSLNTNYIIKNDIIKNYENYGYEDDEEMEIDLDILLEINYPELQVFADKKSSKEYFDNSVVFDGTLTYENRERRKKEFSNEIRKRDKCCIVTGKSKDTCEAAHIIEFCNAKEDEKYDLNNAILLQAGIHKSFDRYYWSINSNSRVVVSKKALDNKENYLITEYDGKKVNLNNEQLKYMKTHYKEYIKKNNLTI